MALKYLIIYLTLIILSAGGGVFGFWLYQKNSPSLKTESGLEKKIACAPCPSHSSSTQTKFENNPIEQQLPVIVYEPSGVFNQEEKNKLEKYLINPFFDYYNEKEIEFITMIISKYQPTESYLDYDYEVMAVGKNGGAQNFLYSSKDFWRPDCMGPCPFSDAFKTKYPEIANP